MAGEGQKTPTPAARAGDMMKDSAESKKQDVRTSCILAAKAVADAVRTSLGPRGMDKMIVSGDGEVVITNDGATIMDKIKATHPAAKMLVDLSKAQDIEAGDGTTSVVVLAGALLDSCMGLLARGIHPMAISESFQKAGAYARKVLEDMAIPVNLEDRESLLKSALTSMNSKVVSQYSSVLAPIAVDAVLKVIDPKTATNVELKDIKIVTRLGGTLDESELVDGMVFPQKASHKAGGPTRVQDAKILLIQFCLSAPKTDMENQVVVSDYAQMDRVVKEERKYILNLCKQIKATGANVLLVQKSILRDALSELALHFLAKMDIMVVRDIDRKDIDFICKGLGCLPVASVDGLSAEKLGHASLVQEVSTGEGKIVKMTGIPNAGRVVSVLIRGSNKLVLGEADRSLHDALCVVRSLVKNRYLICGGGAPETEVSVRLAKYADTLGGVDAYCIKAYAEALEVVPVTLAENAGLHAIGVVTELRNKHVQGFKNYGVNVKKGGITDMQEENVIQPLLVSYSALSLATETVQMILKIDDIVESR